MEGYRSALVLIIMLVISFFAISQTLVIKANVQASSEWTIEIGSRLEGGWPENPCVIGLSDGTLRMYYDDLIPELYPLGKLIKSAVSVDGLSWTVESGIRVGYGNGSEAADAGGPEVIRLSDGTYRMYYAHHYYDSGLGEYRSVFLSATSVDGLAWTKESGIRLGTGGPYDSKNIEHMDLMKLPDGTYRMYYSGYDGMHYRILSAVTLDGLTWTKEAGVRVDVGGVYDSEHVLSSLTLRHADGTYTMFYLGHSALWIGQILSAVSADGLTWTKEDGIRIDRGSYTLVAPSAIVKLPGDLYRMYITADRYPIWTDRIRILSATGKFVSGAPVGGFSVSMERDTIATILTTCLIMTAVLAGIFTTVNREMNRRPKASSRN